MPVGTSPVLHSTCVSVTLLTLHVTPPSVTVTSARVVPKLVPVMVMVVAAVLTDVGLTALTVAVMLLS